MPAMPGPGHFRSRVTPDGRGPGHLYGRGTAAGLPTRLLAFPQSDIRVLVPPESLSTPQRTQVEGLDLRVDPDPLVRPRGAIEPSLTGRSETGRSESLERIGARPRHAPGTIDLGVQQVLSSRLRALDWKASVVLRESEVIALDAPSTRWIGLAVDIGTTKIAVYLVDMKSGDIAASAGLMNPQISYGEDVVSRIYTAGKSAENAGKMQTLLVDALNSSVAALCAEIGSDPSHIADAVIVGNTAIHHLFLRLPVQQLGLVPYVPAVRSAVDIKARDIGLKTAPGGYVHMLPNIAGYVGADHVAMLLAIEMEGREGVTLALDIGTNTEICLNCHGKMKSVSCASGPAFEGAHIQFGMRAAKGAIERVRLSGTRVEIQTIGGGAPVGICGSGLLDGIAQMLQNGVIDASGRMLDHPLVRKRNDRREFVLVERPGEDDITISQKDVRELQAAKAAIRLGIQALIEDADIDGSGYRPGDHRRRIRHLHRCTECYCHWHAPTAAAGALSASRQCGGNRGAVGADFAGQAPGCVGNRRERRVYRTGYHPRVQQ